jgi:hypothetical protein
MTLDPSKSNYSYFASFTDQLYPLRIIEVENGVDAMSQLAHGNITKIPSNGPGLRGINSDLVMCSGYKDVLQTGFQQCTICNSGCPVPVPTECRVDPQNFTFVPSNPYYGTWLFSTLDTAMRQCVSPKKLIVVVKQTLPYTEHWDLSIPGWTIVSYDGAQVLVSSSVLIYASNIHIRGMTFIHAAGIYSPTMTSSTALTGQAPSNITLRHCIFNGTGIKQSAILGSYNSLSLLGVKYTGYQSPTASVVDISSTCGILFIQNNTFVNASYSALTASNYDAVTIHDNKFKNCGRLAQSARPYCVYISACQNTSTRIVFSRNKQHVQDYKYIAGNTRIASYWVDTLPFLTEQQSPSHLPYIDLSFNVANGLDIGLRVTNVEDDSSSTWARNRNMVAHLSSGSKNQDVRGSFHYIVWGFPSADILIQEDPEATEHFWCDNDCSSGNQVKWLVVIFASVIGSFVFVSLCICLCCIEPPQKRRFVDGVWLTTNSGGIPDWR